MSARLGSFWILQEKNSVALIFLFIGPGYRPWLMDPLHLLSLQNMFKSLPNSRSFLVCFVHSFHTGRSTVIAFKANLLKIKVARGRKHYSKRGKNILKSQESKGSQKINPFWMKWAIQAAKRKTSRLEEGAGALLKFLNVKWKRYLIIVQSTTKEIS